MAGRVGVDLEPVGGREVRRRLEQHRVDDIRAAHEHALAVGAVLLQAATDFSTPDGFQVYADPAGHPFCLCWGP